MKNIAKNFFSSEITLFKVKIIVKLKNDKKSKNSKKNFYSKKFSPIYSQILNPGIKKSRDFLKKPGIPGKNGDPGGNPGKIYIEFL